jgi:putative PIN family toxin of toxin-antitoxin system
MKVVLDTNIVVSGLLAARGSCGRIMGLVASEQLTPCVDSRILEEYTEVLGRPKFGFPVWVQKDTLHQLRRGGQFCIPPVLGVSLPDPQDIAFIEVAACCDAPLVTGNLKHFPKRACKGVEVMSVSEIIKRLWEEG